MVVFTVTLVTLAFNPTSFLVLGLLAMAWIYLFVVRSSPIVIGGRTFRCLPHAILALVYGAPAECFRCCVLTCPLVIVANAAACGLDTDDSAIDMCACCCSDREKALGMAIVTLIVVFFLTR